MWAQIYQDVEEESEEELDEAGLKNMLGNRGTFLPKIEGKTKKSRGGVSKSNRGKGRKKNA